MFRKISDKIALWMSGRNGVDELGSCTLFAGLVLQLIASFTGSVLCMALGTLLYLITLFRIFSRNLYRRQNENTRFLSFLTELKQKARQTLTRLKNTKEYRYFKCPQCKTMLRMKRGQGEKTITCPKCRNIFKQKS